MYLLSLWHSFFHLVIFFIHPLLISLVVKNIGIFLIINFQNYICVSFVLLLPCIFAAFVGDSTSQWDMKDVATSNTCFRLALLNRDNNKLLIYIYYNK